MNQKIIAVALGLLLAGLPAGARAQDIVTYIDRDVKPEKAVEIQGTVEDESPAGVKLKLKGKTGEVKPISFRDIVSVRYKVSGVADLDMRRAAGLEERATSPKLKDDKARADLLAKASDAYKNLESQVKGSVNARRYYQYRVAHITYLQSLIDPTKAEEAIKLLAAFRTDHPTGWEIVPALKVLARLQEDAGKADEARKTYEQLAELPDLPPELKQESDVLVGRLLLRAGKAPDAEKRLRSALASLSKNDPQRPFIQAYLAEAQMAQNNLGQVEAQLTESIRDSVDPKLKAAAHNLLGDYYLKKNQPEEAFWHYLRVDALYNDDPEEYAKALYHLRVLFDKVKRNLVRAEECGRLLKEDRRLTGTVYHKLAAAEEKK